MSEYFVNTTKTTLSSNYTAGDGVINVVTTAVPFPQAATFRLAVLNTTEDTIKVVLKVTAVNSSTQWAVVAEGTDANATSGDHVVGTWWTTGALTQMRADICQYGTRANRPTLNLFAGQQYECSDCPYSFVYNGSSWDAKWMGLAVTEPSSSGWSWINQNGSSVLASNRGLIIGLLNTSSNNFTAYTRSVTSGSYTAIFAAKGIAPDYISCFLSDGTKLIRFWQSGRNVVGLDTWTTVTAGGFSNLLNTTAYQDSNFNRPVNWYKVVEDSTNRTFYFSENGQDWVQFFQHAKTTFLTTTNIGIGSLSTDTTLGSAGTYSFPIEIVSVSGSGL